MEEKHIERKKPNFLKRFLTSYRRIPDKKPYIEFVTAILSIPVLLTVILLNLNTLTGNKEKETNTKETTPQTIVVTAPATNNTEPVVIKDEECIPEVGPIEITAPEDGETVEDNPVFVSIRYEQEDYCSVVWSYRINGGRWSDYDDRSIALYNPPPGNIRFELRVKSIVSDDSRTLTRNFIYQGTNIVQTTPTASTSAN